MKIQMPQAPKPTNPNQQGRVVIAQNITRVTEHLDRDGNVIDPRTKVIIKRKED